MPKLQVTIKEYLAGLQREEKGKPQESRRYVPTMGEVAKESGISFVTVNRLANQHNKQVRFDTMAHIIKGFRAFGFDTKVCDLLIYEEA